MRSRTIKSYMTPDEYRQVAAVAKKAGVSISKFVKRVCLAQEVRSTVDYQAVLALAKTNADMGRLGGLFKMALSEGKGRSDELRSTLRSIEQTKEQLERDFEAVVAYFRNRSPRNNQGENR